MDSYSRKRGKDKSKNTFNKYGKYTNRSLRIRQAETEAKTTKQVIEKSTKQKS